MSLKKKVLAFLGIILLLATSFSCVFENGEKTTAEDTEKTTDDDTKTGFVTTTFTSSTLALAIPGALSSSLKGSTSGKNISDYTITPTNISGGVLSLLFALDGYDDFGVVVFGDDRPDIAEEDAPLESFDLANPLAISLDLANFMVKPGFPGGTSSNMVLPFGYVDFTFDVDSVQKVIRVATASVTLYADDNLPSNDISYVRGDVLMQNIPSALPYPIHPFEWYDLDTNSFTTTRPANPYVISEIANFYDPIRPNMIFYSFNVTIKDPNDPSSTGSVTIPDEAGLNSATAIETTVDFIVTDAIVIEDYSSLAGISNEDLVTHFNISQNFFGYGESGLGAFATFIVTY